MAVKFFGQFLVEKGVVTRDDLLKAMDLQERKNLKLGEMAMAMGYVTEADINRAHNAQLSKDIRLGDMLVEMGIMTAEQLADVITRQKNTHLYIGEALVLVNAITSEQLQEHLDAFKADQADYAVSGIELPMELANSPLWEMAADLTFKMITRVLGLQYRVGKCRLDAHIAHNFMFAAIDLSGDASFRYLLSVSEGLQKTIAKAILHEDEVDGEPVEVLEDTVMEFINIVCGNVAAKSSQMGKILNIEPPQTIDVPAEGLDVPRGSAALCFPIHAAEGERMELILLIPR